MVLIARFNRPAVAASVAGAGMGSGGDAGSDAGRGAAAAGTALGGAAEAAAGFGAAWPPLAAAPSLEVPVQPAASRAPALGFARHGTLAALVEEFLAHDLEETRAMRDR